MYKLVDVAKVEEAEEVVVEDVVVGIQVEGSRPHILKSGTMVLQPKVVCLRRGARLLRGPMVVPMLQVGPMLKMLVVAKEVSKEKWLRSATIVEKLVTLGMLAPSL
jgi:hypothetical protein